MELSNTTKRKKRKTRKCLDEIRKRSRRTGQILLEKDYSKVSDNFSNHVTINNYLLTNNRITLRMFPKAVRSETITRPALENKPNLNSDELVKGTEAISSLNSNNERMTELIDSFDNNIENFKNEIFLDKCALEESINYKELNVSKSVSSQEENLSSNFDNFTSMGSTEATDNSPDSIGAQSVSTLTTSSNHSLHDDFGYHLYEEFMSDIPTYLKQNAAFVEEDVMKKTKVFLQNLFIESCYQECEENVLKNKKGYSVNKKGTPGELIVHDPKDYIRLGHAQQQNLFHQPSRIVTTIGGCSTPHSPLLAPSLPTASPDSPLSVIVNDTPDYTYYPHRLN